MRFIERFAEPAGPFALNILGTTAAGTAGLGWPAFGVARPIEGEAEMVLVLAYYAPPDPGQPPMQLQVLAGVQAPDKLGGDYGIPVIVSDLDAAQADHVLTHDVPPSLIDAMVTAAKDANWVAENPEPRAPMRQIVVDATSHFSRGANPAQE